MSARRQTPWTSTVRRGSLWALLSAIEAFALLVTASSLRAEIDVWIDPGHGGGDPGALGFNGETLPNEKELAIGVTTFLQGDLSSFGYIAHRTQNSDTTYFSPSNRRRIANGEAPNDLGFQDACRLLLSVHMNSAESPSVIGTETYHATIKYDAKKKTAFLVDSLAAEAIHPDLIANANVAFLFCSWDRGIKKANFAVLKGTRAPALLMEICFISNQCQFNNIGNPGDQALIADGIAAGVSGYLLAPPPLDPWTGAAARRMAPAQGKAHSVRAVLDEGFEGTTFPPAGWTTETVGLPVPHTWHRTTDVLYVGVGTGSALVGGESPNAIDEWLISPGTALGDLDTAIRFQWSGSQVWATVLNANLNIRSVGSPTWTELWSLASDEPPADPFVFRERVVDLSAWEGENVEFGFRVVGADGADFVLDEVLVGDFEPTAPAPNDVCASAVLLASSFDIDAVTCYAMNDLDPFAPPPGSCIGNELGGPDVFYRIEAGVADTLRASVTAEWGVGLYLLNSCIAPTCLVGGYSEDARTAAAIEYVFPAAGSYFLVVDGEEGSCGPFQLIGEVAVTLTAVPPAEGLRERGLLLVARPNPGREAILLQAELPIRAAGSGVLEIFTVAGARVWSEHVAAGTIARGFTWDGMASDGSALPSGIYLARLRFGEETGQVKIALTR